MINRIVIVENRSWMKLETASQSFLEASLKRVCGSRLGHCQSLSSEILAPHFSDCVFVCPIALPSAQDDVQSARSELEKCLPSDYLFGIYFALLPEEDFEPDSLLEDFWIATLDDYYDIAVPAGFAVVNHGHPSVQLFEISAGVSAIFRHIDNLRELRKIAQTLTDLEKRVQAIESAELKNR